MRAAFIAGRDQIEVRDIDTPALQAGDVLVRVHNCGICGSDLHALRGDLPPRSSFPCGHEVSGEVVAVAGVDSVSVGDRITLAAASGCGECPYCTLGAEHLCQRRSFLGMTYAGGMAEYVRVPAKAAHKLPHGLDYELGALAEPLAIPVHGLHLANLRGGQRVLVLGAGAIGLLTVLAAKVLGAGEVFCTYRYSHQGDAALAVGATDVYEATESGMDAIRRDLSGRPIDLVVEAVGGQADTLEQAISLVGPGGRVLVLGIFSRPRVINPLLMALRELHLLATQGYRRNDMETALRMLAADPDRARKIISHRLPLQAAAEAFRIPADKSSGSLKVQVTA
jgi:2-desacetyl-2-hydroxyethyl bacteriochlorophyllide A dehydrogenase